MQVRLLSFRIFGMNSCCTTLHKIYLLLIPRSSRCFQSTPRKRVFVPPASSSCLNSPEKRDPIERILTLNMARSCSREDSAGHFPLSPSPRHCRQACPRHNHTVIATRQSQAPQPRCQNSSLYCSGCSRIHSRCLCIDARTRLA